jgi:hypothetical protein
MTINSRIEKLEKQQLPADVPSWAELLEGERAVLHYQDGRAVAVDQGEIPRGVKCYQGWSPDDWDKETE